LKALRNYEILDTASEEIFDDMAKLASKFFKTPIATVTLIDAHRQWFKAKVGVSHSENPREVSFCSHTILEKDPLIVNDATQDNRFKDNPLVTCDSGIRFYAGTPLVDTEGFGLGNICVIDTKPREFTEDEKELLVALGRQTVKLIEFRRLSKSLSDALKNLKKAGELIPICSCCKSIRDDQVYWDTIETYLKNEKTLRSLTAYALIA
jgi:GAF domain-containing protein